MSSDFVIRIGHTQLQLLTGDITRIAVDAIVNAANTSLFGVDGDPPGCGASASCRMP